MIRIDTDNKFDRCTTCILSSSFPNIEFDKNGVCNVCRDKMFFASEKKSVVVSKEKIEKLLLSEKKNSGYDAVMCYSGGKDSTYTLMLAVQKYKLKVLSFTLDNGYLAPEAFENINRVVDKLGVDQITLRPSVKFFRSVIKASALKQIYTPKTLVRISSGCNSCISLVNMMALRLAIEKKIPFILAGFTLGQIPAKSIIYKNHYRFFQDSREPVLKKLRKYVGPEIDNHYCLDEEVLSQIKSYPSNINLLCLENVSEMGIIQTIEPIGWKNPEGIDGCSSNCILNVFNNYVHNKRFGYSPYELELSHLIRQGLLTREDALKKIYDQPLDHLSSIMSDLEISDEDLENLQTEVIE
ncbi:MAG: phosphoadenosine phosphosulfate reductase family protein [Bacteroidetes bacterium]|nr:phosphoadenosine phosphosulfate reductase family protein [Bacteroidota bacterium]